MKKHTRKASSYDKVNERLDDAEGFGVDRAVEDHLDHRRLNRKIARHAQALFEALPTQLDRGRWFEWEQLVGRRSCWLSGNSTAWLS